MTRLDTDEYLQLAMHAAANGDVHASLQYLTQVLEGEPRHAGALYLRAAQHARIGLVDRAIDGMASAVSLNPGAGPPRLHLALLLLDRGHLDRAREQFQALAQAGGDAAPFASALEAWCAQDPAAARTRLDAALERTPQNPVLAAAMQEIWNVLQGPTASPPPPASLFMGAYSQPPT
jgi:Tfp pilus assembly protein PilF